MSYTELKIIHADGTVHRHSQFSNSHGFAPLIWGPICERFLGDRYAWRDWKPLERLAYDKRMPQHWRAMLQLTFDRPIIEVAFYGQAVEDMRKFVRDTEQVNVGGVNHLPAIAETIQSIQAQNAVNRVSHGVCFRGTSVGEDPWVILERPDGASERPYNLNRDTGHFSVYAKLHAEG